MTPFLLDGRQFAWNSVTLGLAKDCARKYKLAFINGWQRQGQSHHLVFGMHYAKALERFHKLRSDNIPFDAACNVVVWQALTDTWLDRNCKLCGGKGFFITHAPSTGFTEPGTPYNPIKCENCHGTGEVEGRPWDSFDSVKNRQNLIRSIIWYLEEYRNDPCETVILEDGSPAVELKFELPLTSEIVLVGHIDRLVNYAGGIYVQDQKTTGGALGAYYFNRYNPDNQMSLYSVASKVVYKTPVQGVMIDAAEIKVGFTRFARGFTYRTETQCDEWLRDTEYHIKETWRAVEAGYPMRDTACQKYGGCQFLGICSKDERVREEFLRSDFEKVEYNPLDVR